MESVFDKHRIYFFSVGGALSGFLSWAVSAWLPVFLVVPQEEYGMVERLDAACISVAICVFAAALSYRGRKATVLLAHLALGATMGAICGLLSALALEQIRPLAAGVPIPAAIPMSAWFLTGALVGASVGVIKHYTPRRVLLSLLGGALGGCIGGAVQASWGRAVPHWAPAIGLLLTGLCISLFSASTAHLSRRATLMPLDSRALSPRTWKLNSRVTTTVGNDETRKGKNYIYLPDASLSPRRLEISARNGLFRLRAGEECDPNGSIVAVRVLRRGREREARDGYPLTNGTEIWIGESHFKFIES